MANSGIIVQKLCVCLSFTFLLLLLLLASSFITVAAAVSTKIVLPLIHHDSISSPFYKPKLSFPPDDIRGPLIPDKSMTLFMVNVSIGEPPVPQLLAMDTGSQLVWVCTTCSPAIGPVFDPKRSSTFSKVSCSYSYQCFDYFDESYCNRGESQCSYQLSYQDGTNSTGVLATEKFTFETSDGGIVEVPNVVFGCGLENKWNANELSGVFGLEPFTERSLTSVLGNKFSYCIGNISDPYYKYNQLILGDGAKFEGASTRMAEGNGHYLIKMEGVSIGEKQVQIDAEGSGYNTLIDSGTTSTYLKRRLFEPLQEEIMRLMDGLLQPVELSGSYDLCYRGNLERDLKGFPTVSLHFGEGADLEMIVEAVFRRLDDNVFCLNIDPVEDDDINIIGVYAQQYYNVGFDMTAMTVSFQYIDCALLED